MGTLGGLTLGFQGGLALLQLAQSWPQLIHGLHQPLFFPPTGGQGLSKLQQSLTQWGRFIAFTAGSEAESASALREAASSHGTTFFKQLTLKGDGPRAAKELSGTAQIAEHLCVSEDIGEHVGIDRFVTDQVHSSTDQATCFAGLGAAAASCGSRRSHTRGSDFVERQEGESASTATFQQVNCTRSDAVIVHHHLTHSCSGSHFKSQAMAFINVPKLSNRAMKPFQARFEQQSQGSSASAFLEGFPAAVVAGNVALESCLFLFEPGTGALLDGD